MRTRLAALLLLVPGCAASEAPPPAPAAPPLSDAPPVEPPARPAPPAPPPAPEPEPEPPAAREWPFDPSPQDRPALGLMFLGAAPVPPESGYAQGLRVAAAVGGSGAEAAGIRAEDVLVEIEGTRFPAAEDDPLGRLRERLAELAPETDARVTLWRADSGLRTLSVRLGRQPPRFDDRSTPPEWLAEGLNDGDEDPRLARLLAAAQELVPGGRAGYLDTLERNRRHHARRDVFRLRESVEAQLRPAATERIARRLTDALAQDVLAPLRIAAGHPAPVRREVPPPADALTLEQVADRVERMLARADAELSQAFAAWSTEERAFAAEAWPRLAERIEMGEYLGDDEDVARERSNRRLLKLLAGVDRAALLRAAEQILLERDLLCARLADLCRDDAREGLLLGRDTPHGRIEFWGRGHQRHTRRCAFRFDFAGDDDWLDCAGRADSAGRLAIDVDWSGNDLYGATSPFALGGALFGIGMVLDVEGDDQYVARTWSQGAGVAGFGLLEDWSGDDLYHGLDACQGVGLVGAGVLADDAGDDIYTGNRFCQGVGMAGGVGALREFAGDDRYHCGGRHGSEYGEPGLFSGWGQGVGYGFRHVTSGGIGLLLDRSGDEVYEAGNFSQGGGYFYALGVLEDRAGDDRHVGSRYAQGFAAHQAVGVFLDDAGNDLYQSHAGVANGLSWDETTVLFRDGGGDDVYRTAGFSLASAAHNGIVIFLEAGGDDEYADLPGKASSNTYHGGRSFALFADLGGRDRYGARAPEDWNDRATWRHDGAYTLDLPDPAAEPVRFARPEVE